jgi:hypothetical protein
MEAMRSVVNSRTSARRSFDAPAVLFSCETRSHQTQSSQRFTTKKYFLGSDSRDKGELDETHRLKRETAAGYFDEIESGLM